MLNGDELRIRRAYLNLSQKEFAKRLEIHPDHLSRIERESRVVGKRLENKYAELFGNRRLMDILKKGR